MSLENLKIEDFAKCQDQTFLIHVEGREPLETKLVEVRGLTPPDHDPDRRVPFSLVFEGPLDTPLEQAIFKVENEVLGELDLFVVTVGPVGDAMRHEVVFT